MRSVRRMIFTSIAIVGMMGLTTGMGNAAGSMSYSDETPRVGGTTGSGAGGTATPGSELGARTTIRQDFTVERVDPGMGTGRGGTMGTGAGGTMERGTGGTMERGTGGTMDMDRGTGGTMDRGTGGTMDRGTGGTYDRGTGGTTIDRDTGTMDRGTGGTRDMDRGTGGTLDRGTGGTTGTGTGGGVETDDTGEGGK